MAFIPSRAKKHNTSAGSAKLNLTSMMDMFTIILVFLLKTYATEGQLLQPSESLTLPKSNITTPLEMALDIVVSKKVVMLNDKKIVELLWIKINEAILKSADVQGLILELERTGKLDSASEFNLVLDVDRLIEMVRKLNGRTRMEQ